MALCKVALSVYVCTIAMVRWGAYLFASLLYVPNPKAPLGVSAQLDVQIRTSIITGRPLTTKFSAWPRSLGFCEVRVKTNDGVSTLRLEATSLADEPQRHLRMRTSAFSFLGSTSCSDHLPLDRPLFTPALFRENHRNV